MTNTAIPRSINRAARNVTLRHPSSMPCSVWRRRVTRVDPASPGAPLMGGMPTLGGMGVLTADDEPQIEYVELGDARVLVTGQFQPGDMVERGDAMQQAVMQEAQIEAIADPGSDGYFTPDRGDLVAILPGMGVVLAYSVEGISGAVNIPPYVRKFQLSPRDDLHHLEPFRPGVIVAP